MDGTAAQGIQLLFGGTCAFLSLLFGFRWLGNRYPVSFADEDSWLGREVLNVTEVRAETSDIVTVKLVRSNGKNVPRFAAGQFLTVQIGKDAKQTRSYSISSSALERSSLSISVKRVANGAGSSFVHSLKAGDTVTAFAPSGSFTDAEIDNVDKVFVAGGIGITPLLSMIQTGLESGRKESLVLFYGARSEKDLAFHEVLKDLAIRHPQFKFLPVVGKPIDFEMLRPFVNEKTHFFICGPSIMMDALSAGLMDARVGEECIHTERFVSPQSLDGSKLAARKAEISFDGQIFVYEGKQTLLEFFESAGVHIPYACRTGVCGTCKCRARGETESLTDAGLSLKERREGWILTCVTLPLRGRLELLRE